jgi:hypothetical protein
MEMVLFNAPVLLSSRHSHGPLPDIVIEDTDLECDVSTACVTLPGNKHRWLSRRSKPRARFAGRQSGQFFHCAPVDRSRRAGFYADRLLPDCQPVNAIVALAHHATGIKLRSSKRAGGKAQVTTRALGLVNQNNAIFWPLLDGTRRTYDGAGGPFTVHAGHGNKRTPDIRESAIPHIYDSPHVDCACLGSLPRFAGDLA